MQKESRLGQRLRRLGTVAMMPSDGHTCYSCSICKIKRRRKRERARERSLRGHIIQCMFGVGGYSGHNTFSCLLVVVVILFLHFCFSLGWRKMGCLTQARAINNITIIDSYQIKCESVLA